jgi:hypothetical protein
LFCKETKHSRSIQNTRHISSYFMGIDHILLSPELLASLYPHSLVADAEPFLGRNLSHISFLCENPDKDFLPEEQLVFLHKMLSACKYSMDDIVLINIARSSVSLDGLKKQFQPDIIFLWGVSPESIGITTRIQEFSVFPVDGISIIRVPTPNLMTGIDPAAQALKQQLWTCLKKLFSL